MPSMKYPLEVDMLSSAIVLFLQDNFISSACDDEREVTFVLYIGKVYLRHFLL